MLKIQMGPIALLTLLIGCLTFISCDAVQELVTATTMPEDDMTDTDDMMPADDTVATDDMPTDHSTMTDDDMMPTDEMIAGLPMYISMYASWLATPASEPVGSGIVHGEGDRTVYISDVGAMALGDADMNAFPAGTIIVKEIMDDANTFVQKIATMVKTDDPMYAAHNGWIYKKYARPNEDAGYMQVRGDGLPDAAEGCHGCHAAAPNDSVFVQFPTVDVSTEGMNTEG